MHYFWKNIFLLAFIFIITNPLVSYAERGDITYINENTYFTEYNGWKKILLKEWYLVVESKGLDDRIEVILTDRKVWWIDSNSVSWGFPEHAVDWNSWYVSQDTLFYAKTLWNYSQLGGLGLYDAFLLRDLFIDEQWYIKVEMLSWKFKWKIGYISSLDIELSCVEQEKYNIFENYFDFSQAILSFFNPYCDSWNNNESLNISFQNDASNNNFSINTDDNLDTFDFSAIFEVKNNDSHQEDIVEVMDFPQENIPNQWDIELDAFDFSTIFDF